MEPAPQLLADYYDGDHAVLQLLQEQLSPKRSTCHPLETSVRIHEQRGATTS